MCLPAHNKDLLLESLRYCQLHKGLELYPYVIMPNHVHLITGVAEGESHPREPAGEPAGGDALAFPD
ncbi:hypothetical protein BH24BAC1_BH24BAC1_38010 [soil metagenome]|jgi:REP element-mobilizing transposase RayT